jgi:hypothetical protein
MSRVASPRTPPIYTKNKEEEESRKTARLVEIVRTALSREVMWEGKSLHTRKRPALPTKDVTTQLTAWYRQWLASALNPTYSEPQEGAHKAILNLSCHSIQEVRVDKFKVLQSL